ncbi:MAG: enoyl-CoA hydratase/isomerase family protein [Acidimicrobiales bacterium]
MSEGFTVAADDHDRVRVLTLTRPDKLNAFTPEGYRALKGQLDVAREDPGIAVCVLTGAGRAFSAGVDLTEMTRPGGAAELGTYFDPLLDALARFPKPLLAAVNGLAVGFGATILLHCDLVVVDAGAQIRMPFITLGTCAEAASSWLLPRRVGQQEASRMVLTGAPLTADEAVANGFALATSAAGRVVEDTLALARQLAANKTAALIANKRLLRDGWADKIDEVWQREKAEMAAIAAELGSIGWSRPS